MKPGLATDILSIWSSLFFISGASFSANSIGEVLFSFDKTIATLVEISQSNFGGGISALIPLKLSGTISWFFLLSSTIIELILSKYNSKIFNYYRYKG